MSERQTNAQAAALVAAINAACDARGDDAATRAALIAECGQLSEAHQHDARLHFECEASIWRRANGIGQ